MSFKCHFSLSKVLNTETKTAKHHVMISEQLGSVKTDLFDTPFLLLHAKMNFTATLKIWKREKSTLEKQSNNLQLK